MNLGFKMSRTPITGLANKVENDPAGIWIMDMKAPKTALKGGSMPAYSGLAIIQIRGSIPVAGSFLSVAGEG